MIRFRTKVVKVEEKKRIARGWMVGEQKHFEEENLGYYVLLDGYGSSFYIGHEKPAVEVGDIIEVIMRKVS